ncbi:MULTISPECIES: hypothetical protein [unclassified Actinobaculum]|jgi:hypothetical protein|uniref:hypothetical protein n=1 Tax=unclassified Actinobaculum TaxID=2609299 RepID=UPI000F73DA7A|nr:MULTISPECIES: hypothetical protein [unclassified Actinobaculum]RTE48732.1 hypothetical protein EKN07_08435 [Actinobaculum sp. 352]
MRRSIVAVFSAVLLVAGGAACSSDQAEPKEVVTLTSESYDVFEGELTVGQRYELQGAALIVPTEGSAEVCFAVTEAAGVLPQCTFPISVELPQDVTAESLGLDKENGGYVGSVNVVLDLTDNGDPRRGDIVSIEAAAD